MDALPQARTDIMHADLDDEVVLYDPLSNVAHNLNRSAAAVFRACNGKRDLGDLREFASEVLGEPLDDAAVLMALDELDKAALLQVRASSALSRRKMIARSGFAVAAIASTPSILSLVVPLPAAAASGGWGGGGGGEDGGGGGNKDGGNKGGGGPGGGDHHGGGGGDD